jgi:hypothetical protein
MPDSQPALCPECSAQLLRTSERYAVCPNGHGGLVPMARGDVRRMGREDRDFVKRVEAALKKERP